MNPFRFDCRRSCPRNHTNKSKEMSREKSFALLGSFARKFFICVYSPGSLACSVYPPGRAKTFGVVPRLRDEGGCSFVVKNNWRFKFAEARQRFRLTPIEKRVAVFVLAAVVLGLATKCYRDTHFSPTPATGKIEQASSVRTKTKRVSPKPTRELGDR